MRMGLKIKLSANKRHGYASCVRGCRAVKLSAWLFVMEKHLVFLIVLTVWQGNKAIYRPTVHYAYCVSDSTLSSLHELKMRQLEMQPNLRILNDDIIDGADELGCLLMGHDFKSWWIGSVLDISSSTQVGAQSECDDGASCDLDSCSTAISH